MIHNLCVLHITNQCNLRCKHCYASAGQKLENELSLAEIKKLIDDLDKLGTQYIILSGGEPFLHKGFFKILGYCNKKKIHTMITSNGTLITDAVAKKLKEYAYLDSVQVSIDSHDPKKHNDFRGLNNAFQLALNGIKACMKSGIKVSVMTTLSKMNIGSMEKMLDFFSSLGVDGIAFERFVPEGRGADMRDQTLSPQELKTSLSKLAKLREKNSKIKIWSNDPLLQFTDKKLNKLTNIYKKSDNVCGGCSAGILGSCITPDGYVTPCTRMYKRIASIREQSLRDIWENHSLFKKLRRRKGNLKGKCGKCEYINICGGCRAAAFHASGDVCAQDPSCWLNN
jgi:radical SAM protein with 4Fe4S-binding SPASM domain